MLQQSFAVRLVAVVVGVWLVESAQAQQTSATPSASLSELEQLALRHNPTLAQAAQVVEAARGKALQAGLHPNPTIGYSGELIGVERTAGEFQGGFVEQTIVTAHKLRLSRAKYEQEALEASFLATAQEMRVLNGVRAGFFEILAAQRSVRNRRDLLGNAKELALTRKEMHNIGLANTAEVLEAEAEVDRASLALLEKQNRLMATWEKVAALVGAPGLSRGELQGRLEPDAAPLTWDESLARLLAEHPQLQAARVHITRDELALKRERVEPIPNLQVRAGVGRDFETRNTVANVEVGLKLPLWNKNQGTIRQAETDLARSHLEVERLELMLRKRLADAFQRYDTARARVTLYNDSVLPKARKAYDIMMEQHKKKRAEWITVVEYQHKLLTRESEYTDALLEFRRYEVAIRGLLLDGALDAPGEPRPGGHLESTPEPR